MPCRRARCCMVTMRQPEGHDGAGLVALARHQAVLLAPACGDDNAFAEVLFRTAKYRPEFPLKGFAELTAARQWAMQFLQWYNHEHRHSGIRYVTPAQRHAGRDQPSARSPPRGLSKCAGMQPATLEWDHA